MQIEVPDKEILECKSSKAALRMTLDRSPNSLKAVAIDLGVTESLLSRALNPQYDVNLRHALIVPFMVSCGNTIYLRWLFLRLKELQPELVKHSRQTDLEIIGGEMEELKILLRESIDEIKRAQPQKSCGECGAMFALAGHHVPKWMVASALWIEWEMGGSL